MATRRLILFVLTIFALQLSWSAIAAYCEHETGQAAQHFGHHTTDADTHQVASTDKEKLTKKASVHSHCSSCAHATLSFEGLPVALVIIEPIRVSPLSSSLHLSSLYSARPERPQWNVAV
jgi:hypothetical protein